MNHYESDAVTRVKDQSAIEAILRLDARGLHDVVTQQHVSMCGFGPAVTMLTAVKSLGATSAELVKYATSGRYLWGSRRSSGLRGYRSQVERRTIAPAISPA